MAGISLNYNGVELSQWFDVTDVQRNIGTSHVNSMTKVGRTDGQLWQYMSRDTKTIVVTGIVTNANLANLRRDLGAALDVDEPEQLIIGDDIGVYYLAIYDGQPTIAEDWRSGTISLTFIVPDGIAHSLSLKTVSGQSGTDITVNNAGTAPTAPILTATMTGDNGVVSWLNNQGGVLQFGSPDEIDGLTKERSEQVYHYTFDSEPTDVTLNDGVVAYPLFNGSASMPNQQTGPFDYTRTPGTATPASVRTADMKWSGPSMSGKLPVNSAGKLNGNFQWVNQMKFSTTKNTTGRCEFNLTKGDKVVVSLLLYDNSRSNDMLKFEGTVNDQHLFLDNLPRSYYKDGEYNFIVTKMGDQVSFRLNRIGLGGGGVETYTIEGFNDDEIDSWTVWLTGFSDDPGWMMNWEDSYFNWINVDYWDDIPNRFKAGDVVTANVADKTVSVNGAEDPTLQTLGNTWDSFLLNPGTNQIRLMTSPWATGVTGKVEYREAFV